jgi:dimethylhistidine N-methyltransferase
VRASGGTVESAHARKSREQFATDAGYYLRLDPRQLPSRYLYDALGSALFEAICRLPWYPLTRAEARLLQTHGREIFEASPPVSTIVELGPGDGAKLAGLIEQAGPRRSALTLHLIDVSASALEAARNRLERLSEVQIVAHHTTYEEGLQAFRHERPYGRALALFHGSNIGNFDPPGCEAFLRAVRRALGRGDALVLGVDLVKDERKVLLAYDDPLGVTAAFNRNLLVRINRELGGDFDIGAFAHRAVWDPQHSRVEMHLVSQRSQQISIPAASLSFQMAEGQTIWTESSYKYQPEQIALLLERCDFQTIAQWIDGGDHFALTVAEAV